MITLAERVKDRMEATGLTNAKLAAAAGVKPPTSYNWASGKTKNIKGEPLLLAAAALGVTPNWLATGKGEKYQDAQIGTNNHIRQAPLPHASEGQYDVWTAKAIELMMSLTEPQREGALAALRTHIQNLSPPRNGTTG